MEVLGWVGQVCREQTSGGAAWVAHGSDAKGPADWSYLARFHRDRSPGKPGAPAGCARAHRSSPQEEEGEAEERRATANSGTDAAGAASGDDAGGVAGGFAARM